MRFGNVRIFRREKDVDPNDLSGDVGDNKLPPARKLNALEEAKLSNHDNAQPIQTLITDVFQQIPGVRQLLDLKEPTLNLKPRNLYYNTPIPPEELDGKSGKPKAVYASNKIRTTKYTPLNFLPKNILFQFQNVANIYFLLVAILSGFTIFGTNNPGLASVPIIAIVVITAFRDAFEDWRRQVLDLDLNNTVTTTLVNVANENSPSDNVGAWRRFKKRCSAFYRRAWFGMIHKKDPYSMENMLKDTNSMHSDDTQSITTTRTNGTEMGGEPVVGPNGEVPEFRRNFWKNVRVGDFVKVYADEGVPADMVVLSCSDPEGDCYIDTRNLDGESNLKGKVALKATKHMRRAKQLAQLQFKLEVEGAGPDLNSFGWQYLDTVTGKAEAIGKGNFLPRGSTVRNSRWIIGYVVYTGVESKIILNAGETPTKRSRLTRDLNFYVACSFVYLFLMCLVSGVVEGVKFREKTNTAYFFDNGLMTNDPPVNGFVTFFAAMLVLQNMVPISLYISIEIARTALAFFIYSDYHMYDEETDYPLTPKSWALSDDLGQIEFIFSDKTGTLTQNSMVFRKCTVNGKAYGTAFTESMAGQIKRQGGDLDGIKAHMEAQISAEQTAMRERLDEMYLNPYLSDDTELVSEPIVDDLLGESGDVQQHNIEMFALTLALCNTVVADVHTVDPAAVAAAAAELDDDEPYGPGLATLTQTNTNTNARMSMSTSRVSRDGRVSRDAPSLPLPLPHAEGSDADSLAPPVPEFRSQYYEEDQGAPLGLVPTRRSINTQRRASGLPRPSMDADRRSTATGNRRSSATSVAASQGRTSLDARRTRTRTDSFGSHSMSLRPRQSSVDVSTSRVIGAFGRRSMSSARPKYAQDFRNMEGKVLLHKAESPDESALVKMARDLGYTLVEDGKRHKIVDMQGTYHEFEVLQTLLFTSSRKRMSVIVRNEAHRYFVLTKGADSMIASLLSPAARASQVLKDTEAQVEQFGEEGLRTLMIAYRELEPKFAKDWANRFEDAMSLADRDETLARLAGEVECDLELLGGTGIEDQLQEDVPHTIEQLGKAGIKLWMLTGDKVETAISIGFSCNLLDPTMELLIVRDPQELGQHLAAMGLEANAKTMRAAGNDHSPARGKYAMVIDGDALAALVGSELYRKQFALLGKKCKSVLCCRVSPSQKAAVVYIMKTAFDVTTVAVGDGANDVSMIQVADIGIGIVGVEGRQAAMSADFAMGQFSFMQRLLLVHGRWSYQRVASIIETLFFQNFMFSMTLFWYCCFNQMDQSFLYDYTYVTLFNSVFVSVPVVVRGIYDQDLPDWLLLRFPQVYAHGILRRGWTKLRYFTTAFDGIYQSVIAFFFAYSIFFTGRFYTLGGIDIAYRQGMGTLIGATSVFVCNTYVLLGQYRWDLLTIIVYIISNSLVFAWTGIYTSFIASNFYYEAAAVVYDTATFWAYLLLACVAALMPRFVFISVKRIWFPSDVDVIREQWRAGYLKPEDDYRHDGDAENYGHNGDNSYEPNMYSRNTDEYNGAGYNNDGYQDGLSPRNDSVSGSGNTLNAGAKDMLPSEDPTRTGSLGPNDISAQDRGSVTPREEGRPRELYDAPTADFTTDAGLRSPDTAVSRGSMTQTPERARNQSFDMDAPGTDGTDGAGSDMSDLRSSSEEPTRRNSILRAPKLKRLRFKSFRKEN